MDVPSTPDAALNGTRAVFSVQDHWTAGFDGEVSRGTHLAQAVARAGVFVLQPTMAIPAGDGGPEVPHYQSKRVAAGPLAPEAQDRVRRGLICAA